MSSVLAIHQPTVPYAKPRIAVSIFFFVSGFSFSTWTARIPDLKEKIGVDDAAFGVLLFALPLGLMLTMPLASYLLIKYNSKKVMMVAALAYATMLCLLALVSTIWEAAIILFLFGAARNVFNIAVNTQAVGVQCSYQKSIITGFHGIWSVAAFAGAGLASLMVAYKVSLLLHFTMVASSTFILIIMAFPFVLKQETYPYTKPTYFTWPSKGLVTLGCIAFSSMVCEGTMSDWSCIYFEREVNVNASNVTMGYMAYLAAVAIGRCMGDVLLTKYGSRLLLQMSGLCIATGIFIAVIFPYMGTAMVGFLVTGFGVSCIMPMVYGSTAKIKSVATGQAIASVATIGYLGFLSGPPLVGFIAHALHLKAAFLLAAIFGMVIVMVVSKSKSIL